MTNEQKLREALLPCPFCGGPAAIVKNGFPSRNQYRHPSCVSDVWNCPGKVEEQDEQGGSICDCRTDEEAVALWNRRATTQPPTSDEGAPGPKILPAPSELHKRLDEWWTEGGDPFERIEQLERYLQSASAAPEGKADLRARIRLRANMIVRDHELQPQIVDVITDAMESVLTPYVQLANRLKAMEATPPAATDGFVRVTVEPTDEWAERFCHNVNWHPDGTENKFVEGRLHTVSFRDLAKGYIRAMLAAAPQSGKKEDGSNG